MILGSHSSCFFLPPAKRDNLPFLVDLAHLFLHVTILFLLFISFVAEFVDCCLIMLYWYVEWPRCPQFKHRSLSRSYNTCCLWDPIHTLDLTALFNGNSTQSLHSGLREM